MNGFLDYISLSWDHVLELAIGHAIVVAIALVIDIVIGVALGVLVYRRESAANVALAITSTFLTIPSFALFGLFRGLLCLSAPRSAGPRLYLRADQGSWGFDWRTA